MSDITDDDLEVEGDDSNESASAPKALRDQAKKLAKENAELRKQFDELNAKARVRDLADALETHGAPKKLAKYAARDLEDTSADAVLEWLKENGEDFGWEPEGSSDDSTEQQAGRISAATQAAPPTNAGTSSDLLHKLRSGDYKSLVEAGLVPA
jgi:hypothetical protein